MIAALFCAFVAGFTAAFFVMKWFLSVPKIAARVLRLTYRAVQPHWHRGGQEDPRRVCPLCGWTDDVQARERRSNFGDLAGDDYQPR